MGKCKYCGQDAGFLKSSHAECKMRHDQGLARLSQLLLGCFERKRDFYLEVHSKDDIIKEAYLSSDEVAQTMRQALDTAVERYLDDGIIDSQEEQMVARFMQFSGLPQSVLNRNHSLEKVVQSKVLQSILNGERPAPNITIGGDFPFMLGKTETLVWLFRNVTLHEQKTRREYRGRSRGMSFRIAKGVYYRTGGFRGTPVETTYMQRIDTGCVCLTDKYLYFASPQKTLKIAYSKILSVETYANGVGIQKDAASAKPLFFEGMDSWFTYNVIANLK